MALKEQLYDMIIDFSIRNKIDYYGERNEKTLYIGSEKIYSIQFKLKWLNDHYAVYVMIKNDNTCSPAIASLWTTSDVVFFLEAVLSFKLIHAKRPKPNENEE